VDVKKRVGYMPEESHLYPYLNAEETLDFFGRIFRLSGEERERRIDALIDMVGLNRARTRPVGQYSKGMARRLGLAQALINDPDFLILDEPTTGLDPIGTRQMKDLINTLRERGKTILLCSHLLADVEEICDRVCILYGGKRRAIGGVDELLTATDQTQIRMPKLDDVTMRDVLEYVRSKAADGRVEVSNPSKRLEDYFLDVVEQARREKLQTAGAEHGSEAAEFLGGRAGEGERLLDELVHAGEEAEKAPEERETPPAPEAVPPREVEREAVLSELMESEPQKAESAEAAGGREEAAPAAGSEDEEAQPSPDVRDDVLSELMADESNEDRRTDES
jgi:ABC-2 type transport system ATP-binding protein